MSIEKPHILQENEPTNIERKVDFLIRYFDYISLSIEGNKKAEKILGDILSMDGRTGEIYGKIRKSIGITDEEDDYLRTFLSENFREDELDFLLERFETKVYLMGKPEKECAAEGKRVLLYATDPIYYNAVESLIKQLASDERCKAIGLITDGVAERNFKNFFKQHDEFEFQAIAGGKKHNTGNDGIYGSDEHVFMDALKTAEGKNNGYDAVVTTIESFNSPCASSYWNSKSNFGAKRMYLAFLGWTFGREDIFKKGEGKGEMDSLDGVFCVDDLSRKIAAHYLPDISEDKFHITGSPIMDEIIPQKAE
jgi:hypothetical protein